MRRPVGAPRRPPGAAACTVASTAPGASATRDARRACGTLSRQHAPAEEAPCPRTPTPDGPAPPTAAPTSPGSSPTSTPSPRRSRRAPAGGVRHVGPSRALRRGLVQRRPRGRHREAIVEHRRAAGIDGPLFLGADTHALSEPAFRTALEVLAAHEVDVVVEHDLAPLPTPVVSYAILRHAATRRQSADGIVITPSHNPPEDGASSTTRRTAGRPAPR
jgi:hypothetical protein